MAAVLRGGGRVLLAYSSSASSYFHAARSSSCSYFHAARPSPSSYFHAARSSSSSYFQAARPSRLSYGCFIPQVEAGGGWPERERKLQTRRLTDGRAEETGGVRAKRPGLTEMRISHTEIRHSRMDLGEADDQQGKQQVFQQFQDAEISSPSTGSVESASSWEDAVERTGPETLIARPRGPRQTIRSSLSAPVPPPGMLANSKGSASQRCVAYCTAEQFDWDGLLKVLQKSMVRARSAQVPSIYFSEVIHVNLQESKDASEGDVFFFKDGSLVLWAIPYDQVRRRQTQTCADVGGAGDEDT
eukprot:751736-Hanusia_phi.AAC.6